MKKLSVKCPGTNLLSCIDIDQLLSDDTYLNKVFTRNTVRAMKLYIARLIDELSPFVNITLLDPSYDINNYICNVILEGPYAISVLRSTGYYQLPNDYKINLYNKLK